MAITLWASIRKHLLDWLFPIFCIGCGKEGTYLCDDCTTKTFHSCHAVLLEQVPDSDLDGLWAITDYSNLLIRNIIKAIKYNYITDLTSVFDLLVKNYFINDSWRGDYILVPVPLHKKRYLQRGFNQSELICKSIGDIFGNKIETRILKRKINNKPQAKLSDSERKENVRDIFEVDGSTQADHLFHKTIVLVDDVYTTGSTMQECAKVLKKHGFSSVRGLVLAKG